MKSEVRKCPEGCAGVLEQERWREAWRGRGKQASCVEVQAGDDCARKRSGDLGGHLVAIQGVSQEVGSQGPWRWSLCFLQGNGDQIQANGSYWKRSGTRELSFWCGEACQVGLRTCLRHSCPEVGAETWVRHSCPKVGAETWARCTCLRR